MCTSGSSDLVFTVYSCGIITHRISITITLSSAGVVTGAVKIYRDMILYYGIPLLGEPSTNN